MSGYFTEDIPADELTRQIEVARSIGDSARRLVAATVVTDVAEEEVEEARRLIDAATAILDRRHIDSSFGFRFNSDGRERNWGNAVEGIRNAIAPPAEFIVDGDRVWAEFVLGPQYEGPGGLVHGGVIALVLDQVLGRAAVAAGSPGMTGTLTVRYRQGTALGPVRVEAWFERAEGRKGFAKGTLSTAAGVCAEGEGIFIMPRKVHGAGPDGRSGIGDA
ncbi:PaaI family thioesterase [Gordonia sp. CPCC 206044]|uniref:PaaI family thioesterase n=1 Tax=Gordonia sp. CPCC 206044 TaxID=3140793 RepID=UPI003AF3352A